MSGQLRNPDIKFKCRKCGHNLYITKGRYTLDEITEMDCPECGEEGYENWILLGDGNYDKEHGVGNWI